MCGLMTSAAEDNDLLGDEQFGFRKGRSTIDAAFVLTTLIKKAKAKGWHYSAAFIDLQKVNEMKIPHSSMSYQFVLGLWFCLASWFMG